MGNSNSRFNTLREYDVDVSTTTTNDIKVVEKGTNEKSKIHFNGTVKYTKITEGDVSGYVEYTKHGNCTLPDISTPSTNPIQYALVHNNIEPSIIFDIEKPDDQYYPQDSGSRSYSTTTASEDNDDVKFYVDNDITSSHIPEDSPVLKSQKTNACLSEIRRLYAYLTHRFFKSQYLALKTNCPVEIFASTTPINIKSALPNLSSGSRGYYPPSTPSIPRSTAPSYQHDKNAYGLRSGRSTAEVPQLFDSMNEIQHLKSQLNMLSKLIEPDGPSGVRAASVFHSTASKSTQTDLGYLLDRQAKKSNAEITELRSIIKIREETIQQLEEENARLSDSLKTILHNMNKPGNIDKNTMSNSLPIVGQNHSDKTAYKNPSTAASIRPYDDRIQQQQLRQPYPTTPSANQPSMMISPSQKCYMMSRALDYPPVRSSSPSRPENSESSFSTTRTKNRQKSPEKHGKNIKRQLSPTGKRFPHYQPYIHSLMHPDQLLKSDNYKNSNDSKSLSVGLTATQAQIIKSPTQRLLMQSLPTSGYY
ncbi:unnamed protein product [Heterobilharzia americana]|nr:unnamed protein product [Heterobilharzia americana]